MVVDDELYRNLEDLFTENNLFPGEPVLTVLGWLLNEPSPNNQHIINSFLEAITKADDSQRLRALELLLKYYNSVFKIGEDRVRAHLEDKRITLGSGFKPTPLYTIIVNLMYYMNLNTEHSKDQQT